MDQYKLRELIRRSPDAKLRDLVAELLYDDIVALRIRPGSKLNVNQIASTLGVSRTPVAEAIAQLGEVGFVVSRTGTNGYYVLDLNLNDMISLYEVRTAIESEAAALCAHKLDDAAVQRLSELAEAFRDSVVRRDIRGMKDTDMPFHRLIIDGCGNPYLQQCYELLLPKLTMYQSSMTEFIARSGEHDNPWLPSVEYNHISVVSAIRMRMPELARQSMAEHVDASLNFTSLSGHGADPFRGLRG
ncbi:MAG: GntR family transcriptional regulator [Oscillospiraceae bacterium]|nr:GntR family transcriptional regulator [Oscillospiraceae bacterium]